jgi:hypothetical protein
MRLVLRILCALALLAVCCVPRAAMAQPPAVGCWNDCPGTTLSGPAGAVASGPTNDIFVQYGESQFARFDVVGNCGPSWRARTGPPVFPFFSWSGVGVDPAGNLLASEETFGLIHKWSRDGDSLRVWGGMGTGPGKFHMLFGLAVDQAGVIYAGDYQLERVQRFDGSGAYLSEWYAGGSVVSLAIDDSAYVYVGGLTQVRKYTSAGLLVKTWGSAGSGPGQFGAVGIMACDHLGNIYVNDTQRGVIQVFSTSGTYLYQWSAPGAGGLACDSQNNLYVGFISPDSRVCKYGPGPVPTTSTSWGRVKTFYR